MKSINVGINSKEQLIEGVKELIKELFHFTTESIEESVEESVEERILQFLNILKNDLFFLIESPYVDKVYRDSYYNYFSTKHRDYQRDSIRLSFFSEKIDSSDFRDEMKAQKLQESFLGFMTIRPTYPQIIGRSVISPKALKDCAFFCCLAEYEVLVDGIKLKVEGFPHSSQDTETISCAETTIWCIMEYFSKKYSEYKPVLPSEIVKVLTKYSYQRQMPSLGLRADQISFALREFGFGVRLYSSSPESAGEDLKSIFSYYVDSGIPVIGALKNDEIAHAVVYIGYDELRPECINDCVKCLPESNDTLRIIDYSEIERNYIVIDDNHPPYQKTNFDTPTNYYNDPTFLDCKINHLIVPLYQKVYLEALLAREFMIKLIKRSDFGWSYSDEIILRLFLTSSRSYKDRAAVNSTMDELLKELIINAAMPKFIWVAEITDKANLIKKRAHGIILVDATASAVDIMESLIIIAYPKMVVMQHERELFKLDVSIDPFEIYSNNLKGGF